MRCLRPTASFSNRRGTADSLSSLPPCLGLGTAAVTCPPCVPLACCCRLCQQQQRSLLCAPTSPAAPAALSVWKSQELSPPGGQVRPSLHPGAHTAPKPSHTSHTHAVTAPASTLQAVVAAAGHKQAVCGWLWRLVALVPFVATCHQSQSVVHGRHGVPRTRYALVRRSMPVRACPLDGV